MVSDSVQQETPALAISQSTKFHQMNEASQNLHLGSGVRAAGTSAFWLVLLLAPAAIAQPDKQAAQGDSRDELLEHVQRLNDPSYHARQLAQWQLGRNPEESISVLRHAIAQADHNSGAGIVDLLTEFALGDNIVLSLEAIEILEGTAQELTAVGRMAAHALDAIGDLQERQAIEMLIFHSAKIGPRQFSLNGTLGPEAENALHINQEFTGDDETIQWIRFLKSVETVCLEGPQIDRRYLEAIVRMQGLRNVKLKDVALSADDLQLLKQIDDLQHLGLIYVPLDDSAIELLAELPVSTSMKLYGTNITPQGFARLQARLDDIAFYYGRGGFLGVSSVFQTTRIRVAPNSAAQRAGIIDGDMITAVDSKPIKTFMDLRDALSNYSAGQKVSITALRGQQELEFEVTLKEEP